MKKTNIANTDFLPTYAAKNAKKISALIDELQEWPGPRISSHKSANQFFHKLVFLADMGMDIENKGIQKITEKILSNLDEHSVPFISMNISDAHGGSGKDENGWALCDAPNTLYALIRLCVKNDTIDAAVKYLAGLIGENGFGCHVSSALGSWRGPGKKTDPCPYATLIMLKLLLAFDERTYKKEIDNCVECLLDLWEHSLTNHPYIFYMGNDFRKLKLPYIWYDILHVTNVLSQVPKYKTDPRLIEMAGVLKAHAEKSGYIPESAYQPWKEWDFGQKKTGSELMAFRVNEILGRLDSTLFDSAL